MLKALGNLLTSVMLATSSPADNNLSVLEYSRQAECLARVVYFEARGESKQGQRAIMDVVLNRSTHPEFKANGNICNVLKPSQFQWLKKKHFIKEKETYAKIRAYAYHYYRLHITNKRVDSTNGGYFFSSNGVKPAPRAIKLSKIGNHQFFGLKGIKNDNSKRWNIRQVKNVVCTKEVSEFSI